MEPLLRSGANASPEGALAFVTWDEDIKPILECMKEHGDYS